MSFSGPSGRIVMTGLILIVLGVVAIAVSLIRLSWTEALAGLGFIAAGTVLFALSG